MILPQGEIRRESSLSTSNGRTYWRRLFVLAAVIGFLCLGAWLIDSSVAGVLWGFWVGIVFTVANYTARMMDRGEHRG